MENDIALLVLQSPLNFNGYVAAASLPAASPELEYPNECTVVGWGSTIEGGPHSDVLMSVDVPLVEYDDCEDSYLWGQDMSDYFICAGEEGLDGCQGDSGGPLFCDGDVYGISKERQQTSADARLESLNFELQISQMSSARIGDLPTLTGAGRGAGTIAAVSVIFGLLMGFFAALTFAAFDILVGVRTPQTGDAP